VRKILTISLRDARALRDLGGGNLSRGIRIAVAGKNGAALLPHDRRWLEQQARWYRPVPEEPDDPPVPPPTEHR
jgi:hypothetical protein